MIVRSENLNQICCDFCPASFADVASDADFRDMVTAAKAAGWQVRPVKPKPGQRDTTDLFGATPRVAGKQADQPFTHACPACANPRPAGLF